MTNKLFIGIILALLGVGGVKLYLKTTENTKNYDLAKTSTKLIVIYSMEGCGYCDMAKDLLTEKGIKFESVELLNNHDLIAKLMNQTGQKTVPYVYVDGKFIGGYQNLKNLVNSDEFFK
jgi:glutaredoxin 3